MTGPFAPQDPAPRTGAAFVALLPTVTRAARWRFRHVRCPGRQADLVAETIAVAWNSFLRLAARDRDPAGFPSAFAGLAARAVASGRRLAGQERIRDALSPSRLRRHGTTVLPLPEGDTFDDALVENTRTPVWVQAQFRADFAAWFERLSARRRRVVTLLALGYRTAELARLLGVSAPRVSQMRRELRRDFRRFHGGASRAD
jgi:DNA-directed RNA polymerase specialized sigma24 family protein